MTWCYRKPNIVENILLNKTNLCFTTAASQSRSYSSKKEETDEQFDARWEAYFNRPEIDDWELRRGLNELHGHDLVPEPKIVAAALRACRRLNDTAMAVRILEAVKVIVFVFIPNNCLQSNY